MAARRRIPWKFVLGSLIILFTLGVLVIPSLQSSAQYYLTVDELLHDADQYQQDVVRISGAVVGDSIDWDGGAGILTFTIASLPADLEQIEEDGGFQESLHLAVTDPGRTRINIRYEGVPPDLLQDEVQAILTGRLNTEGVFLADELLLKCPSRYQDEQPIGSDR